MRKKWIGTAALLLALLFLATGSGFSGRALAETADPGAADSEGVVDYVLVIDCTAKASRTDAEQNTRKAAAKLFIDLLPVDNARICVIKIGKEGVGADYSGAYSMRADEGHVANAGYRMRCVYTVWDLDEPIDSKQKREQLKTEVEKAYTQEMSPFSDTHCALYAAMDTLKYFDSENACVMLISDQFAAGYRQHLVLDENGNLVDSDHTMMDDVENTFVERGWSMSWIDLSEGNPDYDYNQRLGKMCEVSQGYAYHDLDLAELPKYVAATVGRYSGAKEPEGAPNKLDAAGNLEYKLPEFAMLTEINVVVTGEGVEQLAVVDDQGVETKAGGNAELLWFSNEYDSADARFFYSALKIIRPTAGSWTVRVKGKPNAQVYIQTIQTTEPDLVLESDVASGANLGVGQKIQFTASFQYGGEKLRCGAGAYQQYLSGAELVCTNMSTHAETNIPLSPVTGEQYEATFTAVSSGVFSFVLRVRSNDFKSGMRQSNPIENISVDNHAPEVIGQIENVDGVWVGQAMDKLDMTQYFVEPDGEPMTYELTCTNDRGVAFVTETDENAYLSMTAPGKDGEYELELLARDASGAVSEPIRFTVAVANRAPTVDSLPKRINMVANAPKLMMLLGMIRTEEGSAKRFALSECFTDPDGLPLEFGYENPDNLNAKGDEILRFEDDAFNANTGVFTLIPSAKGATTLTLTATDSAGETVSHEIRVNVSGAGAVLIKRYWPVLAVIAALAAVLLALRASRRVHGAWDVNISDESGNSCYHRFASLAATGNAQLKKTVVSARAIVDQALRLEDIPDVSVSKLGFYNPVLVGTVLGGKCKVQWKQEPGLHIIINDAEIKPGKATLRAGRELTIKYEDDGIPVLTVTMKMK